MLGFELVFERKVVGFLEEREIKPKMEDKGRWVVGASSNGGVRGLVNWNCQKCCYSPRDHIHSPLWVARLWFALGEWFLVLSGTCSPLELASHSSLRVARLRFAFGELSASDFCILYNLLASDSPLAIFYSRGELTFVFLLCFFFFASCLGFNSGTNG